jgi:hypothetical protein
MGNVSCFSFLQFILSFSLSPYIPSTKWAVDSDDEGHDDSDDDDNDDDGRQTRLRTTVP